MTRTSVRSRLLQTKVGDFIMKKILLALTAVAAMTGSASAADLAARPYVKAPMAAPVANWTGFYIFGGAGGGLSNADQHVRDHFGLGVRSHPRGDDPGKEFLIPRDIGYEVEHFLAAVRQSSRFADAGHYACRFASLASRAAFICAKSSPA